MQKSDSSTVETPLMLKTKNQIAIEMGINIKTLNRCLEKVGMTLPRGLIFPEQQAEIYKRLGWGSEKS